MLSLFAPALFYDVDIRRIDKNDTWRFIKIKLELVLLKDFLDFVMGYA